MGQVIPRQHPAVVLKSHYKAVRSLLAVALVAIVALAATVVILANDDDQVSGNTSSAQPVESINYGGFNPATGKPVQQETLPPGTRFDGGPDEGTRGIQAAPTAPGTRFDGGPTRAPAARRPTHSRPAPPRRSSRWARAAASRTRFRQRRQRALFREGPFRVVGGDLRTQKRTPTSGVRSASLEGVSPCYLRRMLRLPMVRSV